MHVGTYTPEGTWKSAAGRLRELADMGITVLEMMPVAEFAGKFGWGYDGVDLFAPYHGYGRPDDLRLFVDTAHSLGLGVVLDVVYNHFGPAGNFLRSFSRDYFSDRYETEWGEAINFDGKNSGPVREFVAANAAYWIDEFHFDGLRLDATQMIFDQSPRHIVAELAASARKAAKDRSIVILAENEPQDSRLVRSLEDGGFGLDGLWNDDFHHSAMVALTGKNEAYYCDHLGSPQELISAAKWGFLYQGQWYSWQNKRRGSPTYGIKPATFVNCIQNHDQIANSVRGKRCHELTSPGRFRAMTALLFLIPGTPMIFQGQEFCASSPFCYFADWEGDLAEQVENGRIDFLKQFRSIRGADAQERIPYYADDRTFQSCKIDHGERTLHADCTALHRDLMTMRRKDPVFKAQRNDWMHGAVIGPEAFVIRYLGGEEGDRVLLVNLGRDLVLNTVPEPLLAPPERSRWELLWSSESAVYGGSGTPDIEAEGSWTIPGHAAVVLASNKVVMEYKVFNLLNE